MIRVGVNEDVILSGAVKNDKGTLEISFREKGTEVKEKTAKPELSLAAQLEESSDVTNNESSGESKFMLFPIDITKFGSDEVEEGSVILQRIIDFKNQLTHILKRYMPTTSIKWSLLAGTGVNAADDNDVLTKVRTEGVTNMIYNNLVSQFIQQITPYINREDKPCRLFLVRRSAESHFGTFRRKFLDNQPFLESTEIPIKMSKMYKVQDAASTKHFEPIEVDGTKYVPNFTKYELERKLDDPNKRETTADNTQEISADDKKAIENMFSVGNDDSIDNFSLEE